MFLVLASLMTARRCALDHGIATSTCGLEERPRAEERKREERKRRKRKKRNKKKKERKKKEKKIRP